MKDPQAMSKCSHPIFSYMGGDNWNAEHERYEQRHRCIDCVHEVRDVPGGSVMVGHAPGECGVCDRFAVLLPDELRNKWIQLTTERRA